MRKTRLGKKSSSSLGLMILASILLVPVASSESIPVPVEKPSMSEPPQRGLPARGKTFLGLSVGFNNFSEKYGALSSGGHLSAQDSKTYREIFRLQAHGQINKADNEITKLSDKSLMGHVLYQRYMHPVAYRSTYTELKNWLEKYADYPGADQIYKLAQARKPGAEIAQVTLKQPKMGRELAQINDPSISYARHYVSSIERTKDQERSVKEFSSKIKTLIQESRMEDALALFGQDPSREWMDEVELDRLQARIAAGFFYKGETGIAQGLATQSAERSGEYAPLAGWIAGLSFWTTQDYKTAASYFEKTGRSEYTSGWMAASGAYWAARSYDKAGNKSKKQEWLSKAATHPRTFYGLLAVQSLGRSFDFNWSLPALTKEDQKRISETKAGRRAMALVAAGQNDLAEAELLRLNYSGNPKLRQAVLAYAGKVGLPGIAMRLGHMMRQPNGKLYDFALYPVSPWQPENGYRLDPALVHAVIRQESRFDATAESNSGALGLMQVMPQTAKYIMKDAAFEGAQGRASLTIPSVNVTVGQNYIEHLLKERSVNHDMVSLLVAYNAGPGNLERWKKNVQGADDPLLFIESIPVKETRDYVERVLSNYWIYSMRAGEETPTMVALSSGKKPRYAFISEDKKLVQLASN